MESLATELIDNIFQRVLADCPPQDISRTLSLKTLCLVCKPWKNIAQPLLLSEYPLHGEEYSVERLSQTLLEFPSLQIHVKSFWIFVYPWLDQPGNQNQTLLMRLLPNLRAVVIRFHWLLECVPRTHFDTLSEVISSDRLTRLCISGATRFPLSILAHCTSLHELYLCNTSFVDDLDASRPSDSEPVKPERLDGNSVDSNRNAFRPKLKHLYIDSGSQEDIKIIEWLASPRCFFDFSELSRFYAYDWTNVSRVYELVHQFVNGVASSLQDLALAPHSAYGGFDYLGGPVPSTQFNPLPNLRSLRFTLSQDITTLERHALIHLKWATRLLLGLSNPQVLEDIGISYDFNKHDQPIPEYMVQVWAELDDILTSNRFPNLRTVNISVYVYDGFDPSSLKVDIPKWLPKVNDRRMLEVTHSQYIGFMSDKESWYHSR